jgi:NTE family protein
MTEKKVAYVLAGGGIKGAWSAGVLDVLMNRHPPDFIYGISVGALNGTLCLSTDSPGNYWMDHVQNPKDLFQKRNIVKLVYDIMRGKFQGLMSLDGMKSLLDNLDWKRVQESKIRLQVGAVNLADGKLHYAEPHFHRFKYWVLASSALPVIFPVVNISGGHYTDGGVREVVPLRAAIDYGADEIFVLSPHPQNNVARSLNVNSFPQLINRVIDIMVSNTIDNDIARANKVNRDLKKDLNSVHREVKIYILRPASELDVAIDHFTHEDICDMVENGRRYATSFFK